MSLAPHYPQTLMWSQACGRLGSSKSRISARAGICAGGLDDENRTIDAETFFALWEAFDAEYEGDDLPLQLGLGAARGPFQPALLGFSCSPDVATGLKRLALFKPLVAPLNLTITTDANALHVRFAPAGPGRLPPVMCATEIVFFLEICRVFSAHPIVPAQVELPEDSFVTKDYADYVGCEITIGRHTVLSFHLEDAQRPLVSADTEFFNLIEKELLDRLQARSAPSSLVNRVQRALTEILPSGTVSAERVARRLGLSKRTLQRRLKDEATTFQAQLDQTREALAITYLRDKRLSIEETSYLLAYQDPNSFYRAFQDWTGMTPSQAREFQG